MPEGAVAGTVITVEVGDAGDAAPEATGESATLAIWCNPWKQSISSSMKSSCVSKMK